MTVPIRIKRERTKGWKMPQNTVYVGRPSCWGNPYVVTPGLTAVEAVKRYRDDVTKRAGTLARIRDNLRGKNLACWCGLDQPCHADVLLELANADIDSAAG